MGMQMDSIMELNVTYMFGQVFTLGIKVIPNRAKEKSVRRSDESELNEAPVTSFTLYVRYTHQQSDDSQ